MPFIGVQPATVPLTSSDITDGIISTAKIADDAVGNTKLDLSANYAFTGTLSGVGKVLQVVTATDSTQRTTTSTSFVTASNTLAVSITPSSTSNKIFVTTNFSYLTANGSWAFRPTIYRGSTNLGDSSVGFGSLFDGTNYNYSHATLQILDSPSTTSATTYQVYIKTVSGTAGINTNNSFASITAFEIAG